MPDDTTASRDERFVPRSDRPIRGEATVPGDKSIAHRALILAGLAPVPVTLRGLPDGQDVGRTRAGMAALGAWFEDSGPRAVRCEGVGAPGCSEPSAPIDCGNSGTTIRLLAGLAAGTPGMTVLTGDGSLRSRPMGRIVEPLQRLGAQVRGRRGDTLAPLCVVGGALRGASLDVPVSSAQVKSCLLLAGLRAEGRVEIAQPHPSRDHTERMLGAWGVRIESDGGRVAMEGGQPLIPDAAEPELIIPGDVSSAAFLMVAAAVRPGSDLWVRGVGINPGRAGVIEVLRSMGAAVDVEERGERAGEPVADVRVRGPEALDPYEIDGALLVRCIDEIPILAVAASAARGTSVVRDAAELRHKESDRLASVGEGLAALGAEVSVLPDGLEVTGGPLRGGVALEARGDHRLAMSWGVAGGIAEGGVTVRGASCAAVSWPGFFETLAEVTGEGC